MERMVTVVRSAASVATKSKTYLAPMALQGLEVLALPIASLPEYIEQIAESNPLVEIDFSEGIFSYSELPDEHGRGSECALQTAPVSDAASEIAPPLLIEKEG